VFGEYLLGNGLSHGRVLALWRVLYGAVPAAGSSPNNQSTNPPIAKLNFAAIITKK
jgi:hypothetical protein